MKTDPAKSLTATLLKREKKEGGGVTK